MATHLEALQLLYNAQWNKGYLILLCCIILCDILADKIMCCLSRDTRTQRSCVRYLVSVKGIYELRTGQLSLATKTEEVKMEEKVYLRGVGA